MDLLASVAIFAYIASLKSIDKAKIATDASKSIGRLAQKRLRFVMLGPSNFFGAKPLKKVDGFTRQSRLKAPAKVENNKYRLTKARLENLLRN